ncbi:putative disease resistance RPP13-like protein 1 [Pistacia vera]|uniref:putative disease resistance RPP13-like protein 1 n=1 Tax=Pistacia vera TaxID=55513 RepID=UPI001262F587|nr:putative disease resistance RPP13-like protein 1 [Pistacia vera]
MEVVAEPIVSVLFEELVKKLGSVEVRSFARQLFGGVDSELEKLKTTLENIKDLLTDAEEKQLSERAVKRRLAELQNWAYDAEDILDEFAYELALRRHLKAEERKASSSKALNLATRPRFNFSMWLKIKKINSQLEQLRKEASKDFILKKGITGGTSSAVSEGLRPEETSSVPPEQTVHGRHEDETKLLELVKNDQPSGANKFRVIAIVGMGGIGKTTIARAVYHHNDLEGFEFDKAWVCVSQIFDILTISKNILRSLKHSSSSNPNNLNEAQVELQKAVNGKKILIVLDDVWEVDYRKWEQLMSPFKAGAPGSTMIVTTRDTSVAKRIRCPDSDIYALQSLSDEACWSLFWEHALAIGAAANVDLIADSIRKRVLERCSGLPLAAKTLGGLLHSKPINTWERILDSEIWNSFKEKDVIPVLMLSYLYLPPHLKRCFAYCAVFPKGYEFEENELILLWMAESIIQQSDEQLDEMDETGLYFTNLCSRSLFQKSCNDGSKYVMHDLVHDLAELVSKEFNFRSEKAIIKLSENVKRIRHFSYRSDGYDLKRNLKA